MPRSVVTTVVRQTPSRLPVIHEVVTKKRSKRRRNARGSTRARMPRAMSLGPLAAYLACMNNPFECSPVRLGFGTFIPTTLATAYIRGNFNVNATDGSFSLISFPSVFGIAFTSAQTQVASPNWTAISAQGASTYAAMYGQGRCLAGGVRVFPMIAATSPPGMIALGLYPSAGNTVNLTASLAQGNLDRFNGPMMNIHKACSGVSGALQVLWRPEDVSDMELDRANSLSAPVTIAGAGVLTGITDIGPFIAVAGLGLPTTTNIWFEAIYHFEMTLNDSATTTFATAAPETTVRGEGQATSSEHAFSKIQENLAPLSGAILDAIPFVTKLATASLRAHKAYSENSGGLAGPSTTKSSFW